MLECPVCAGDDDAECPGCKGTGRFEIDSCPKRIVTANTWAVIEAAELYEKGLPPVAGGQLDQTASFLSAARFVWSEQSRWKAEMWKS